MAEKLWDFYFVANNSFYIIINTFAVSLIIYLYSGTFKSPICIITFIFLYFCNTYTDDKSRM